MERLTRCFKPRYAATHLKHCRGLNRECPSDYMHMATQWWQQHVKCQRLRHPECGMQLLHSTNRHACRLWLLLVTKTHWGRLLPQVM